MIMACQSTDFELIVNCAHTVHPSFGRPLTEYMTPLLSFESFHFSPRKLTRLGTAASLARSSYHLSTLLCKLCRWSSCDTPDHSCTDL